MDAQLKLHLRITVLLVEQEYRFFGFHTLGPALANGVLATAEGVLTACRHDCWWQEGWPSSMESLTIATLLSSGK